jgi:hypothetical protein
MSATTTRSASPQQSRSSLLYVSTELDTWETSTPEPDQDQICERCGYRRLDPTYYAWLRHRMTVAQRFRRSGRLSAAQYETWRTRFNATHAWAVARFGEAALVAAVEALDPRTYRPPQVEEWEPAGAAEPPPTPTHCFPADGDWRFMEPVSPEALAHVDTVREQALSLGWTEAGLYQNRGCYRYPVGGEYGLVCALRGGHTIGQVSRESIEIISPRGSRLRHYNPDVDQPWLRRVQEAEAPTDSDTSRPAPVCNRQEKGR